MSFKTQAQKTSYYNDGYADATIGEDSRPPAEKIHAKICPRACYELGYEHGLLEKEYKQEKEQKAKHAFWEDRQLAERLWPHLKVLADLENANKFRKKRI